jgi:Predicted solute binding protein
MGVMDAANGGSIYGPQTNDYNRSINFQTSGLTFPSSIPNAQPWLGHLYCLYASWSINCSMPVRDDPDLFALSSNSTVSSLLYNSTSKQLSFTVSGASGTHGYADIYLSKNLAPNLNGLTVYLDGAQLTFNSSSVGNYWILHFVYTHSTHTVTVNLPDQSQSTPTSIPTATPTYSPPPPPTPTPTDTSTPTTHTLSPTPAATGTVPEYPHTLLFTAAILLAVAVLAVPLIYYKRGKTKGIHDLT